MGRPRKYPLSPDTASQRTQKAADELVEVMCIVNNVHLGDGRKLLWQESASVTPELADLLVEKGMAKRV